MITEIKNDKEKLKVLKIKNSNLIHELEATNDVNEFIRITKELSILRIKIEALESRLMKIF